MSEARELFAESLRLKVAPESSGAAVERLVRAAKLWRASGQNFSAGMAMSDAVYAGWGQPEWMAEAQESALTDFRNALSSSAEGSLPWIASMHKLRQNLVQASSLFVDWEFRVLPTHVRELGVDLSESLLLHHGSSDHADNYLVKGIRVMTDLDGEWSAEFPPYEVSVGGEAVGKTVTLNVPSAFHILVDNGDWQRAHEIIERYPNAFVSAGLKGWRAVVLANLDGSQAVERFDEAANAFAADVHPSSGEELSAKGGMWSSINPELWAKYFGARARLVEAIRTPARVKELLAKAVEIIGTELTWHRGEVARFQIILGVLNKLVSADPTLISAEEARKEYLSEIRFSGASAEDDFALTFISEAATALRGFGTDPASAVTDARLARAIDALSRVPSIGPDFVKVARPAIGENAVRAILGPITTWMHRELESIHDEAKLRAVLLRLLQAGLPLYVHLRHGPVEHGKDIVALVEDRGTVVLRHYQVKCGDIDTKKWRESKDELEEMFLVPLESLHLPLEPVRVEGILVTNGHANPFVAPVMDGWFRQQREQLGRVFEFIHLDRLVNWITESRLTGELRVALAEQHGPTAKQKDRERQP